MIKKLIKSKLNIEYYLFLLPVFIYTVMVKLELLKFEVSYDYFLRSNFLYRNFEWFLIFIVVLSFDRAKKTIIQSSFFYKNNIKFKFLDILTDLFLIIPYIIFCYVPFLYLQKNVIYSIDLKLGLDFLMMYVFDFIMKYALIKVHTQYLINKIQTKTLFFALGFNLLLFAFLQEIITYNYHVVNHRISFIRTIPVFIIYSTIILLFIFLRKMEIKKLYLILLLLFVVFNSSILKLTEKRNINEIIYTESIVNINVIESQINVEFFNNSFKGSAVLKIEENISKISFLIDKEVKIKKILDIDNNKELNFSRTNEVFKRKKNHSLLKKIGIIHGYPPYFPEIFRDNIININDFQNGRIQIIFEYNFYNHLNNYFSFNKNNKSRLGEILLLSSWHPVFNENQMNKYHFIDKRTQKNPFILNDFIFSDSEFTFSSKTTAVISNNYLNKIEYYNGFQLFFSKLQKKPEKTKNVFKKMVDNLSKFDFLFDNELDNYNVFFINYSRNLFTLSDYLTFNFIPLISLDEHSRWYNIESSGFRMKCNYYLFSNYFSSGLKFDSEKTENLFFDYINSNNLLFSRNDNKINKYKNILSEIKKAGEIIDIEKLNSKIKGVKITD